MSTAVRKMEIKYGINIVDDSFFDPWTNKYNKRYKIYTADGCSWENGLTFRGLQAECKKYGDAFIEIAENAGHWKRMEELKRGAREFLDSYCSEECMVM